MLIPWVITLVALVGLNALVPLHGRVRKTDCSDIAGLSQLSDDAQSPARVSSLPVFLASQASGADLATFLTSQLLCIESLRQQAPLETRDGAIRGRAPPAVSFA
ncbi:MAG: hypothetical protein ACQCXQ_04095 [Verrucomicrobiales bacterium]|nr:hypothetical protein [Verrucomicrobiota bacterium JB025]